MVRRNTRLGACEVEEDIYENYWYGRLSLWWDRTINVGGCVLYLKRCMLAFQNFINCRMYQNSYQLVKRFQVFHNIHTNTNKFIYFQRHLKHLGHSLAEVVSNHGSKRPPPVRHITRQWQHCTHRHTIYMPMRGICTQLMTDICSIIFSMKVISAHL